MEYNALQRRLVWSTTKQERKLALKPEKDKRIISDILDSAKNGTPLSNDEINQYISMFVERLPATQKPALLFKENKYGKYFTEHVLK